MPQEKLFSLIFTGVAIAAVGIAGYAIYAMSDKTYRPSGPPTPTYTTEPVACAQDAMLCPDGSYVSRVAPKCEFAPCPGITSSPVTSASVDQYKDYRFEVEDISGTVEIDPITHKGLNDPFDTMVWKIHIKTGEKEAFIQSTKGSSGVALQHIPLPEYRDNGRVLKLDSKLFFVPYNAGTDSPSSSIWELDLSGGKFRKLGIGAFFGDFGLNTWFPDRRYIIDTQEGENNQTLRALDIIHDTFEILATTSDKKGFAISFGLCTRGSVDWLNSRSVRYRIYDLSTPHGDLCQNEPPALEEHIVTIK
jgi:hypothetical protein